MNDYSEEIFDEKKIKKAIKKGKRKTIITIVVVSLIVFFILNIVNFAVSVYFSQQAFKRWDAYVRLTTPNGYISETVDSRGLLGGMSHYKISKDMKIKSVVVDSKQYSFGLNPGVLISRGTGSGIGIMGDDWQVSYKANGWREMLFFHPNITYKNYKNDKELIKSIEAGKIYEVALSFDRPYKQSALPFQLPQMTWLWVNTYNDRQLQTLQQEAEEYDWSGTFIRENEALGFTIRDSYISTTSLAHPYHEFLKLLKTSTFEQHKKAYINLKEVEVEDIEILGVIVYGTKDEVLELMDEPNIKASSIGGVIDHY